MLRRFYSMVAREVREEVVADVRAADVVVHPVEEAEQLRIRAVDRAQSASHPGPLVVPEVRDLRRRVLEPRVQHQPEVDPEVGAPVEAGHGDEAELVRRGPYGSKAGDPARRTDVDPALPVRREELRPGPEMVQGVVLDGLVVVEAARTRRVRH